MPFNFPQLWVSKSNMPGQDPPPELTASYWAATDAGITSGALSTLYTAVNSLSSALGDTGLSGVAYLTSTDFTPSGSNVRFRVGLSGGLFVTNSLGEVKVSADNSPSEFGNGVIIRAAASGANAAPNVVFYGIRDGREQLKLEAGADVAQMILNTSSSAGSGSELKVRVTSSEIQFLTSGTSAEATMSFGQSYYGLTKIQGRNIVLFSVSGTVDANSMRIVNLATPIDNNDAATKQFVLDNAGGMTEYVLDFNKRVSDPAWPYSASDPGTGAYPVGSMSASLSRLWYDFYTGGDPQVSAIEKFASTASLALYGTSDFTSVWTTATLFPLVTYNNMRERFYEISGTVKNITTSGSNAPTEFYLRSPNSSTWRVTITDGGALSSTLV